MFAVFLLYLDGKMVQTMDINTLVNSVTLNHMTHDFSALSSGTWNPWGHIQHQNN
jgi:hypothetical protein